MQIPNAWNDLRVYWEKLEGGIRVEPRSLDLDVKILVAPCKVGFYYPTTPDDIVEALKQIPATDRDEIEFFVLRQPTKKERIMSSVWGRLAYFAEIGSWTGPAVFLEAQPKSLSLRWSKSISPDSAAELQRLREDGHRVTLERRHHLIESDFDAMRATQLYRTLPHEIGHHVQYKQQVWLAAGDDFDERDRLQDWHFSRPSREREDFAHRYADGVRSRCFERRIWPFPRLGERKRLLELGLDPEWFGVSGATR